MNDKIVYYKHAPKFCHLPILKGQARLISIGSQCFNVNQPGKNLLKKSDFNDIVLLHQYCYNCGGYFAICMLSLSNDYQNFMAFHSNHSECKIQFRHLFTSKR